MPEKATELVVGVDEGETIYYPESQNGGRTFARPKCDLNEGLWYCATHRERLGNGFQKDVHIHDGAHRLAWMCFAHGLEKP